MRIVIDMQGAQSASRFRGIGRYSLDLALAMARNAGEHEIWLVLNAAQLDSIQDIRHAFAGVIPPERIRVFDVPTPVAEIDPSSGWRTRIAEKIREHFIQQLKPDAVLITSLFEGFIDNPVTSVGAFCDGTRTAVILYDLIPLLNPDAYLDSPAKRQHYLRKIEWLRNAGLLLSISEYSRQEGIDTLELSPDRVVNISTAVDACFKPTSLSPEEVSTLRQRFGISRKTVMYAPGGFDPRKNMDGLITAFSLLPRALREMHQLVLVSKLGEGERSNLNQARKAAGLGEDEVLITGYVSNEDLIALYCDTSLFVIPSKHEGFGLPALEAMACGAPVIGSNSTSIPEVIGLEEALFDASSPASIADKMLQVLQDESLQRRLREHGLRQAGFFSWDVTAKRALRALESRLPPSPPAAVAAERRKPRLALVSPLPPERTGIAHYSAALLPELLAYFDVELIVEQPKVSLPPMLAKLPRHSVSWFSENGDAYDRILYHFGNSPFHSHMFGLLRLHPGVVVLHDFFLSGVLAHDELTGVRPDVWREALYHAHGYPAMMVRRGKDGDEQAKSIFPCNLEVLQTARSVIVHSEHSRRLARSWHGQQAADNMTVIPLLRTPALTVNRAAARQALGIGEQAFVVCSFGFVDPTKLSHRLLEAWLSSRLHADPHCELVLVGANHGGDFGTQIMEALGACQGRARVTGWIEDEVYEQYLQAADLCVQMRTQSRGETSAAVLDCMNYGLPTIVNANGSMADLPDDGVYKLPDLFADAELVAALELFWVDRARRIELGAAAGRFVQTMHDPALCARQYAQAIEAAYEEAGTDQRALLRSIAGQPDLPDDDATLMLLAQSVALSSPLKLRTRQLLVDVSAIARNDLKTGIERVVRAQLSELLKSPPAGLRIEPVYLCRDEGKSFYRYAQRYTYRLLGMDIDAAWAIDPPADVSAGDVFYSPDYFPDGVIEAASGGLYAYWRAMGVEVNFLIHDMLPVLRPEFFPLYANELHARWLACICENADRLVCISKAVADDVNAWIKQSDGLDGGIPAIAVVPHGADIGASAPSLGMPDDADQQLEYLASKPSFLMVGTIEPRKGHLQALAAFEKLWRDACPALLVIVGGEGWKSLPDDQRRTIPEIVARLRNHPELNKRLFWLQGISDEYLQQIYGVCTCLLVPSEGEGFGLPLIEAAQFNLPVIARDLPVFREVAQHNAFYFTGCGTDDLADTISTWLQLNAEGKTPSSASMRWNTWAQNASLLADVLLSPLR
jgi:glycosyltransferase involved in cell wall biosynthesis